MGNPRSEVCGAPQGGKGHGREGPEYYVRKGSSFVVGTESLRYVDLNTDGALV
jgi:hypothetical protein